MRIAQVATNCTPVVEHGSGSIEYLVWLLSRELTRMGHEVTVFGAAGSVVDARLEATLPGPYGEHGAPDDWQLCEWINIARAVERSGEFDVLHTHAYLWSLPLDSVARASMVHTLHVTPHSDEERLRQTYPHACVSALSRAQWSAFPDLPPTPVVPHGVDASRFAARLDPDDYVLYLGRFIPGKGPDVAIRTARQLGLRLLMAGPPGDDFESRVRPLMEGGVVEYLGYVQGEEKNRLIAGARALLYPVLEPEPFGLVQVEAMLSGTPVAAIGIGAVPEIVDEGVTGSCSPDAETFPAAVLAALALDRAGVRARAEQRFSVRRMAEAYVELFEHLIAARKRS